MARPDVPGLVGVGEAADILGVCRQRVAQLAERPDFPEPVAVVQRGRIRLWTASSIRAFGRKQRPVGRPRKG